ncbi:NPC intracellular cholesterol transporter 2-like isoform X1 [Amphibalanus amphitrite]|uniref:NPC intracellular cholesterol transporter 2-like isoform X1 n=1 Tax=Amphibalanus amphitrite TaxID=1232801 RepID=UPI001C900B4C|nr:NPC intracellular cholesterol transporter 2-like isoform X1 [Amphibalanus amphitrite]
MNAIQMTLLVCGLAASALASPAAKLLPETPFISCGADTIKTLKVVGCASLPCILRRGTTVTLNVDIVSNSDTATLASEIYGNLNGVLVPFSADDQACSSLTSVPHPQACSSLTSVPHPQACSSLTSVPHPQACSSLTSVPHPQACSSLTSPPHTHTRRPAAL